ncbi:MAG: FAD binding domain-containing protein [Chloroflexi bacterium]|nr:FAD binding domain-containing protein [Chloroflexota bacterium]
MAILAEYHKPRSVTEAVQLLRRTDVRLRPLAGGSQLVGALETRALPDVDGVVDLAGLGLHRIEATGDLLRLGATATLSDVGGHPVAGEVAGGILRRTAAYEGPVNLRNVATVGGVVASAETDSEFYAALLALGASVVTSDGVRETVTPLADFIIPSSHHLITSVSLPIRALRCGHARVARTPSDRCIVAAVVVVGDAVERVALCGVGERPVLAGGALTPPDDWKGSAEYRLAMAEVVQERALAELR